MSQTPQRPPRPDPPPFVEPPAFRPPPFCRIQLANGLRVMLAEYDAVPLAHLQCAVAAGAQLDPHGLEGLAALSVPLLREGTLGRSANRIAEETEALGADILTSVDYDGSSLALELLSRDLDFGIDLLFDMLSVPTFPLQAFENARRKQIVRLRQQQWQPAEVANKWFASAVYGETAYGRTPLGSEEGLSRIERDDLVDYHRRHFGVNNFTLIGIGSFRAEELLRRLDSVRLNEEQSEARTTSVLTPPTLPATRVYITNIAQAAQTEVRLGHAGIPNGHPDFARLQLVSRVYGNRLNLILRERKGYTYHVLSRLMARKGCGPFIVASGVSNSNVGSAVREMVSEMERLRQEPVPETELEDARNYLAGVFVRLFQSSHEMAAQLKQMAINDLPNDYWQQFMADIRSAHQEELLSLARRYLHPRRLAIVAAGPAAELRHQLAGFGELIEVESAVKEA